MASDEAILPVVRLTGLRPISVGSHLASLGLLRVAARTWPQVRGAYRDGAFCLVGGPRELDELTELVWNIGAKGQWSGYRRDWADAATKEEDRKRGSPSPLWQHSSSIAENEAILCAAHVVATEVGPQAENRSAWRFFNPVLGLGGKVGQRDFAKGWYEAGEKVKAVARSGAEDPDDKPAKSRKKRKAAWCQDDLRGDLDAFLTGGPCRCLGAWNGASWFSAANKAYNSGQGWHADGQITPWAMLLACEGLPFLAGSPSRRLGARTRALGAFPFVSRAAAPRSEGEAGHDRAEVWLPLWSRPMTVPEVRLLFLRGRAEIEGAGASTPADFATAVLGRGVDAGIDGFQRFVLGRTTTDQVFESRFDRFVPVPRRSGGHIESGRSQAIGTVRDLHNRLPLDRKLGNRWQFRGLRGPVEAALVAFAAEPENPDRATALLDSVVEALDRVDRNRQHRKARVSWKPLPAAWMPALFGGVTPDVEVRLAMALASIGRGADALLVHRFGLAYDSKSRRYVFLERAPHRRTWCDRPLAQNLAAILRRRLTDAEPLAPLPFAASIPAGLTDASAWLEGRVDLALLERWLSRLALFDWGEVGHELRRLAHVDARPTPSARLALLSLLRPLLEPGEIRLPLGGLLLPAETGARSVPAARQIAALVGTGNVDGAMQVARARYYTARQPLARTSVSWCVDGPEALLAALLIPANRTELGAAACRWLRTTRKQRAA